MGFPESCYVPLISIKYGAFLDWMKTRVLGLYLLKKTVRCEVNINTIFVVFSMPVALHYVSLMCDSLLPHLLARILLLSVIICVQMTSRSRIAAWGGVRSGCMS